MEAMKNAQFVMYCASQFPKIEIDGVSVKPATHDLYWVEVVVKNEKVYPTSSDRAVKLGRDLKDKLILTTSSKISMVQPSESASATYPFYTTNETIVINSKVTEFRIKGKEMLRFGALVKIEGSDGWIELEIDSTTGGADEKRVDIDIGG